MIHFLSGIPRSGSTLLGAILAQHKGLHVTPTNDLIELVAMIRNQWMKCDGFQAQGLEAVRGNIKMALRGLMQGFYSAELAGGMHVLDKSRAWPGYIELIEEILGRPIKIICTIRDLRDVAASFERLRAKNPFTAPHGQGEEYFRQQTIMGRTQLLFSPSGTIGASAARMLDAIDRGYSERMILVPYQKIVEVPQAVAIECFTFMGLKPTVIDADNLVNPDKASRDIDVWGLPLHRIKTSVQANENNWSTVLPPEVAEWIDTNFSRVQNLLR